MPQIQAIYHNTNPKTGTVDRRIETGLDASERVSGNVLPPADSIRRNTPLLANLMDKLKDEGYDVYSCAEVQALAKLLDAIPDPDYRKITFSRPAKDGDLEYWTPCKNCQRWLTGAGKQYRIAFFILEKLQPQQPYVPFFDLQNPNLFPPLTNAQDNLK